MIKFIRYFIMEWCKYPSFMEYYKRFTKEQREEMEKSYKEIGIEPFKNRFDFALRNAKVYYSHRERYSRKCRKYGGDCEKCNAKHC